MNKNTVQYIGLTGGAIVLTGLIAYFLIMRALGLDHNVELRAFNLLIMAGGVFYAVKTLKARDERFNYPKGIGVGVLSAVSSSVAFAIFTFIFILSDVEFLHEIKQQEAFGQYLNGFTISIVIIIEGIASGFLLSFGFMQWYKGSNNNNA